MSTSIANSLADYFRKQTPELGFQGALDTGWNVEDGFFNRTIQVKEEDSHYRATFSLRALDLAHPSARAVFNSDYVPEAKGVEHELVYETRVDWPEKKSWCQDKGHRPYLNWEARLQKFHTESAVTVDCLLRYRLRVCLSAFHKALPGVSRLPFEENEMVEHELVKAFNLPSWTPTEQSVIVTAPVGFDLYNVNDYGIYAENPDSWLETHTNHQKKMKEALCNT